MSIDRKTEDVLKLGPSDRVVREADNYNRYVQGQLIGMRHAVLMQHKALWKVGGLVYSLIGVGESLPPSFSKYYLHHAFDPNSQAVAQCLGGLFEAWSIMTAIALREYSRRIYPCSISMARYGPINWKANWGCSVSIGLLLRPGFALPHLPHPIDWLADHRASKTTAMQQAITHGDFHGENILIMRGGAQLDSRF